MHSYPIQRWCLIAFTSLILLSLHPIQANDYAQKLETELDKIVKDQQASSGLIGLGAVVFQNNQFIGPSVSGERKKGSGVLIETSDRWHLGSITKSLTATMIARLVEKGELRWNSTVGEIFVDVDTMHSQWLNVSLMQLLTHTSGATPNFPLSVRLKRPAQGLEIKKARESAVIKVLKTKPQATPASTFTYSNVGYTIAGVMAEKKTGLVWEELIEREIFAPLKIQSGGFGLPQKKTNRIDQPRGHKKLFGITRASTASDDNTPIMGPASTIHMSLKDLVIFANEHLQGKLGRGILLNTDTYHRLHTPVLKRNAYGWIVSAREHLGVGPVLWHSGTNTWWYALVTFIPEINAVVAVTTNDGNITLSKQSAWEIFNVIVPLLAKN